MYYNQSNKTHKELCFFLTDDEDDDDNDDGDDFDND